MGGADQSFPFPGAQFTWQHHLLWKEHVASESTLGDLVDMGFLLPCGDTDVADEEFGDEDSAPAIFAIEDDEEYGNRGEDEGNKWEEDEENDDKGNDNDIDDSDSNDDDDNDNHGIGDRGGNDGSDSGDDGNNDDGRKLSGVFNNNGGS